MVCVQPVNRHHSRDKTKHFTHYYPFHHRRLDSDGELLSQSMLSLVSADVCE